MKQMADSDIARLPEQEDKVLEQLNLANIILEGYFEWLDDTGADEGLTVIGTELQVEVELSNAIVKGKIDLLLQREQDGAVLVLDNKTVQSFAQATSWLSLNEQGRMYVLLQKLSRPGQRIDGVIWNMLRKVKRTATSKPPYYLREEMRWTDDELRSFYQRLWVEVEEIIAWRKKLKAITPEAACYQAYPSPRADCGWSCDFFEVCRSLDTDPHATDGLFVKGDPYNYYLDESESIGQ